MRVLLLLIILMPTLVFAADKPIVRAEIDREALVVGRELTLKISVFVPTWFTKSIRYPSFEIPELAVVLPDDSSYPSSDESHGCSS